MVCLEITTLWRLKSYLLVRQTGGIIFIIVILVKVIICVWHECFVSCYYFAYTSITLNSFQNTSSMAFYLIRRDGLQLSKEQQQQQNLL